MASRASLSAGALVGSFFAKRARGAMVRYMVTERAQTVKSLRAFDGLGYRYSATESTPDKLVFLRDTPPQVGTAQAAS